MFNSQFSWSSIPDVTKNLLIINGLVFAATNLLQFQIDGMTLFEYLIFYPPWYPQFKPLQILTHMFHHSGLFHFVFNMWGLFIVGPTVEHALGSKRFLILYIVAGLGSLLLHVGAPTLVNLLGGSTGAGPVLGASGALFGILAAFGRIAPRAQMRLLFPPVTFRAETLIKFLFGSELALGLLRHVGGIDFIPFAHFAHLGGLVAGLALMYFWQRR